MGRALKFSTLFFILTVSLWLCSMLYITEARALNGLGTPSINARETGGVFEEYSSKRTRSGSRGQSYKYSKPTQEGPSPGMGHKSVPSYTYSKPTHEGPSPGIGHKSAPSYTYSKPTQEGPSSGIGHKSVPSYKYSKPTQEGPSPGVGHKNVPGDYQ